MKIFTLNCNGRLLVLDAPKVMGILNSTPDSFFDGGRYMQESAVLKQAEKMIREGAAIIDIGGMSTRPNAGMVSEEEELNRILPVVSSIHRHFPEAILSIDTFRSKVAEEAVQQGASIINDISAGLEDERILEVAARYCCPMILMHRQGDMATMHQATHYTNMLTDMTDYFVRQIQKATTSGIKDIVIDVGFGFSKSLAQNYYILDNLDVFAPLDKPVLVGISRKSMLCKVLDITPDNALNATTAAHMLALQNGASILRAHDVKEAVECIKLYEQIKRRDDGN